MSDLIPPPGPAASPAPAAEVRPAAAAAPHPPVLPPTAPGPLGSDAVSVPRAGAAPTPGQSGGVDWGRIGIAAGLAPVAYAGQIILHEAVGHGGMALALGGRDIQVNPFPHTYTQPDGQTGFRFAEMRYQPGPDWGPGQTAAVLLGPSILDVTLMGAGTALYESGHWPRNPWASGALFVAQAAATVDLGYNGSKGLLTPNNDGADTVRAGHLLGVPPQVVGAITTGLAVAGTVELVRMGLDLFGKPAPEAPPTGPTVHASVSPMPGGGMVGLSGTF